MLTVSKLAKLSDTTPDAIRYYSRIGLLKPKRNQQNGYRLYREKEIINLRFVRKAKYLGYSLEEISQILHDADTGKSACPRVRSILEARIRKNSTELREKIKSQQRLEEALLLWKSMPDGVPDSHSVCHLIELISSD